jgi:hypothetical protein
MPSISYYQGQANLFFRMALACSDAQRGALLEAQGRRYLNLATQLHDKPTDLNSLLDAFNGDQMRKS